ncbi:hypothetical protein IJH89_00635 [Candidatus Saccharibacteria bacterium]|nr:hypothetical protein [Candidatus Saccharibacteria bacterium]
MPTLKAPTTPTLSAPDTPLVPAPSRPASSRRIFIIDDDELFADCLKTAILSADKTSDKSSTYETQNPSTPSKNLSPLSVEIFKNAVDAMSSLDDPLPALIFLDVLLPGADGFTFLNELVSYVDTSKIPIVLVTSLELSEFNLKLYGVKGILNKEKLKPEDIVHYVKRYAI